MVNASDAGRRSTQQQRGRTDSEDNPVTSVPVLGGFLVSICNLHQHLHVRGCCVLTSSVNNLNCTKPFESVHRRKIYSFLQAKEENLEAKESTFSALLILTL